MSVASRCSSTNPGTSVEMRVAGSEGARRCVGGESAPVSIGESAEEAMVVALPKPGATAAAGDAALAAELTSRSSERLVILL